MNEPTESQKEMRDLLRYMKTIIIAMIISTFIMIIHFVKLISTDTIDTYMIFLPLFISGGFLYIHREHTKASERFKELLKINGYEK